MIVLRTSLSVFLTISLCAGPAFAGTVPNTTPPTAPPSTGGYGITPTAGAHNMSLNLGSTTAAVTAAGAVSNPTVINVGGALKSVLPNTLLTPAEYLAALQVHSGLAQTVQMDAHGAAIGGSAVLGDGFLSSLSSLMIPKNVALTTVTSTGAVNISGDLVDKGSLFLGTTANAALNAINVNAANVFVSGLLSSPQNIALNLNATGVVNNSGTISSGGDVNIAVGSGSVTNSGLISSANGSIRVSALSPITDININGTGGTFQAVNGNLDVRNALYAGAANINLNGGNYLSQNLNLYSGSGVVNASIGQVTGTVNTAAQVAHVFADTQTLTLGSQCINGDPTYVSTGQLSITGDLAVSGNLAIIAGQDITATGSGTISDPAGNVLIIAGAQVTTSGTTTSTIPATGSEATSVAVVDFSHVAGGDVNLGTIAIDTSSGSGKGGNVTIVALANGATGGHVMLDTVNTSGTAGGGNILVLGGAGGLTNAVSAPQITTSGTNGSSSGSITLGASQAATTGGPLQVTPDGNVLGGNLIIPATTTSGNIFYNILDAHASSSISASGTGNGGDVAIFTNGAITSSGGFVQAGGTGPIGSATGTGGNGGSITMTAGGDINLSNQTLDASGAIGNFANGGNGGAIILRSTGGSVTVTTSVADAISSVGLSGINGGNGGNGGIVAISAFGDISVNQAIATNGGQAPRGFDPNGGNGGAGGAVLLTGDHITVGGISVSGGNADSSGSGIGGNAGSVGIHALHDITQNQALSITARGGAANTGSTNKWGNGGTILLTSGAGTVQVGTIDTTSNGGIFVTGAGGDVVILANGDVSIGNLGSTSAASINTSGSTTSGAITISASTIALNSQDGSQNVLDTHAGILAGSIILSMGGSATPDLILPANSNINTTGGLFTGTVYTLQSSVSSRATYTVNGGSNPNDWLMPLSSLTGVATISFTPGVQPTNFSPGGYSFISGTIAQVDTGSDSSVIVPLATAGTYNMFVQTANTSTRLAIFGASSADVAVSGLNNMSSPGTFDLVAAVSNGGLTLDATSVALTVGPIVSRGGTATITANSIRFTGPVSVQSLSGSGFSAIDFGAVNATTPTFMTGNIALAGSGGQLTVGGQALFAGSGVTIRNTNNTLKFDPDTVLKSAAANMTFEGNDIYLNGNTFAANNNGDIILQDGTSGTMTVHGTGTFITQPQAFTVFQSGNLITVGDETAPTAISIAGGNVYFSAPSILFDGTVGSPTSVTASGNSTIDFLGGGSGLDISVTNGTAATVATNNGAIIIESSGTLTFEPSVTNGSATLNLNTSSTTPGSFVDIKASGTVNVPGGMGVVSNSPIQLNFSGSSNSLNLNGVLKTTFSGNSDLLLASGDVIKYSILIQDSDTSNNLTVNGTGRITQAGTTPGYTVFNDSLGVSFTDGSNIGFNTVNPGGIVNFFGQQVGVSGTGAISATLSTNNVDAINFNTNLSAASPGTVSFQADANATSAALNVAGAPVVVGFLGTRSAGVPVSEQPLSNVNFVGPLTLSANQQITLSAQNLAFSSDSKVQTTNGSDVEVTNGLSGVDMSITAPSGGQGTIAAGGSVLIHPDAGIEFKNSGSNGGTLFVSAPAGLVDIQGLGDITLDDKVTLKTDSPLQINLNAVRTLTLAGTSVISTSFEGNSAFPDPLGQTVGYSILVQNLITNLNVAGTGTIAFTGATPGNLVFNDFVDVGFAPGTQWNVTSDNPGAYVNFFTRQIQVNGDALNSSPTAGLTLNSNVNSVNFNTNLPSFGPGDVAFLAGPLATSASFSVNGAPVNIGFSGSPQLPLPPVQEPVGTFNVGLNGTFNFSSDHAITANAGSVLIFNGSRVQSTGGDITLNTLSVSNQPILLNGTVDAGSHNVNIAVHGTGSLLNLSGLIVADTANLSSETGNIGSLAVPVDVSTTNVSVTSTSGAAFVHSLSAVNVLTSGVGSGNLSVVGEGNVSVSGSVTGASITLATKDPTKAVTIVTGGSVSSTGAFEVSASTVTNDGNITSNDLTVDNPFAKPLVLQGSGTVAAPNSVTLSSAGDMAVGQSFAGLLQNSTHVIDITTLGNTTLPVSALSVNPLANGNGGDITLRTERYTLVSGVPISFTADAASTGGNGGNIDVELSVATPVAIGTAAGNFSLSAQGAGTGNGGTVYFTTAGNLTVDPAGLTVAAGTDGSGAHVTLGAGSALTPGTLIVKGPLSLNGAGTGAGGMLSLTSSSTTVFTIGSKTAKNGTQGTISVSGAGTGANGSVSVFNNGGGVTLMQPLTNVNDVTLQAAHNGAVKVSANLGSATTDSITLTADGTGTVTSGAANLVLAQNISATSGNGAITLPDINVPAAATATVVAATGSKGAVTLTNPGAGLLAASTDGSKVTLSAPKGGIMVLRTGTNTEPTTLTVNALSNITNADNISAVTSVTEKSSGGSIMYSAGLMTAGKTISLTATKGDIVIGDTTSNGTLTATAFDSLETTGTVTGVTGVTLKTTSSSGSGITLNNIQSGSLNTGTVGGAINVVAAGGVLTVNSNAVITAFSDKTTKATITLQNNSKTAATPCSICIGAGADIETKGTLGNNVTITMGAATGTSTTLPSQPGLTFAPATQPMKPVFFGASNVNFVTDATTFVNVTSQNGAIIKFSPGKLPASSIQIQGGTGASPTIITAKAVSDSELVLDEFVVDTEEDEEDAALTLVPAP